VETVVLDTKSTKAFTKSTKAEQRLCCLRFVVFVKSFVLFVLSPAAPEPWSGGDYFE
jgi:hypothetical protein